MLFKFQYLEQYCDLKLVNGCFITLFIHLFTKKQGILKIGKELREKNIKDNSQ